MARAGVPTPRLPYQAYLVVLSDGSLILSVGFGVVLYFSVAFISRVGDGI